MDEKKHKCNYCGSEHVHVSDATTHELNKEEWIFLIGSCLIIYFFSGEKGFIKYIYYVDLVLLVIFGVRVYREEETLKNRFKLHCHDCGREYYFFENESSNVNPPVNEEKIEEIPEPELPAEDLKNISKNEDKNSVIENYLVQTQDFIDFISKVAMKICEVEFENPTYRNFNKVVLKNDSDDKMDFYIVNRKILNDYFISETDKIIASTFPKKYGKDYLINLDGIVKAGEDDSVSNETLAEILDEYFEILYSFLKKDLLEYAERKFSVTLSYDEKYNTIDVERQNLDEIEKNNSEARVNEDNQEMHRKIHAKVNENKQEMHRKIHILAEKIYDEQYSDCDEEKLFDINKILTDYVRMEAQVKCREKFSKKYPKELAECRYNIDRLMFGELLSSEERDELLLEFSEVILQVVDNDLPKIISKRFPKPKNENVHKNNDDDEKKEKELLYFQFDESMKQIFSIIGSACDIVFEHISFEDFPPEDDPIEIVDNDIKSFYRNNLNEISSKILSDKYSLEYLANGGRITEIFKDKNLSADTVKNIVVDYKNICGNVLKKDLFKHIKQKYGVEMILNDDLEVEVVQKKKSESNKNGGKDFNSMYQNAVKKIYSEKRDVKNLLNYGGLAELEKTLFKNEKIILVLLASESLYKEDANILKDMLSDDILVLTDKRLLYLQKKLFGTRVFETPRQAFSKIVWDGNRVKFNDLDIYSSESNILKEQIYSMM